MKRTKKRSEISKNNNKYENKRKQKSTRWSVIITRIHTIILISKSFYILLMLGFSTHCELLL